MKLFIQGGNAGRLQIRFLQVLSLLAILSLALNAAADPVPPPMISQIVPNFGPTNGGAIVTITGTGFQPGTTVSFGSSAALSVSVNSNALTVITPPAYFGPVSVTVSNVDGKSSMLLQGYTYHIEPSYIWTTIAGTAIAGSVDGTNNGAHFNRPSGIAKDAQGNIYIANTFDSTIRELMRNGTNWVSSTIAGLPGVIGTNDGIGSGALFFEPDAIAVDPSGNIYVGDNHNLVLRKLTLSGTNWVVSTVAGSLISFGSVDGTNGMIRFQSIGGLTSDAMGNIYISDGRAVRKLTTDGTNFICTTLATGFSSLLGIGLDNSGDIYVADSSTDGIYQLVPSGTNWIKNLLTGTSSGSNDGTNGSIQLSVPYGITVDAQTNLFVADEFNDAIRELSPVGTNWISSTIAGVPRIVGSTDGTNTNALFFRPQGIILDAQNNLVIADTLNCTIRELTPAGTNWISSTIAGQAGSIGIADGANGSVQFDRPTGIAVDGGTNIYVADSLASTVRKLSFDGTNWNSSTIAGKPFRGIAANGTNQSTTFVLPWTVAADAASNVYVADETSVRKLTLTGTNYVAKTIGGNLTLTGNPPSSLDTPQGIALDTSSNVYISDTEGTAIVKLALFNGSYSPSTIAGPAMLTTGTNDGVSANIRFSFPTGIAADTRTNLYIADTDNNTIRELTLSNSAWISTTIAGQPGISGIVDGTNNAALFFHPMGIAVDMQTNLYITDSGNYTIRKLSPVGTNWVSMTIGGLPGAYGSADGLNNETLFSDVNAVAIDANGNLYVADSDNNTIRLATFLPANKLTPNITWPTPATVEYGAALDTNQLDASADVAGSFSYNPGAGVVLSPGTNILSAVFTPVDSIDYNTVTSTVAFVVLSFPPVVTLTPANPVGILSNSLTLTATVSGPGPFIYQWQIHGTNVPNNFIKTIAGNGSATVTDGVAATNSALSAPMGLASDLAGNFYIADTQDSRIRKIGTDGIITTVAGTNNSFITFGGDGGPAVIANLSQPSGVTVDAIGNIYIADTANNRVRKVDTNGIITTFAGTNTATLGDGGPAVKAGLSGPQAVALDASGNLLIADTTHGTIRKVDANGIITTIAGSMAKSRTFSGDGGAATNAGLSSPGALAVDAHGNLFIADTANGRIRVVDTNGIVTTIAGKGSGAFSGDGGQATNAVLSSPTGVALDSFGNIFIADTGNGRIRVVNTNGIITTVGGKGAGSFSGDGGSPTNAVLSSPSGLIVDSKDSIYFADKGNNRIREIFTSSTLVLTNLTITNAGVYDLIVTSPYGSTTNSVNLPVGLSPLSALVAGPGVLQLQLNGAVGATYILQTATNLAQPVTWTSVATNKVAANGTASFSTTNSAATLNRYYRVRLP